ncbi:DUF2726 domain-containing protein [Brevundimonas sp. NPDC090276]|uniref:DUF2726 domain-containing protein n=1 Tax=Brevundimonas sp. NPDC090276 TaxID=3363956 RepID=UPI00383B5773
MTLQAFLQELTSADNLPLLMALIALLGFLAGLKVGARSRWTRRSSSRGRWRAGMKLVNPETSTARSDRPDPAAQLTTVMNAEFRPKRLMSRNEARAFLQIERLLRGHRMGWRVMAQVSLGEVLTSTDAKAFAAVNSKRVDMLVIANDGHPLAAVEFQGSGHYLGTAAARDAVKREALRRAGVDFIEVKPDHSDEDLAFEIARLVRLKTPSSPQPA